MVIPRVLLVTVGCLASCLAFARDDRPAGVLQLGLPPLEEMTSVRDGRTGGELPIEALLDRLSGADIVFLGESHTDDSTHRLQLHVYQELLRRTDGRVVLAMEMFHRDQQADLDGYLNGRTSESDFDESTEFWSNYREAYRPLIERAKRDRLPVVASNFPRSLLRRVASEKAAALETLSEQERRLLPEEFLPNTESYWRRVDNAIRGHSGMIPASDAGPDGRLYSVQSLWDNAMGDACVAALRKHPDHIVLHINGGFHSAYGDGAAHQARLRAPDAVISTVAILPSYGNPRSERRTGRPPADYVATVEARATNIDQGFRSVSIGGELKYLLHRPTGPEPSTPLPLIIWLTDEGLNAKETLPYCESRFGDHALIAVVEPPYRERSRDLASGGRWFWPDTFASDVGGMIVGIERIVAYLSRQFAVDEDRVLLVGEGAGGTIAAAVAVRTDILPLRAFAIRPTGYSQLKDLPLLLPEGFEPGELPDRSLTVIDGEEAKPWWDDELRQYNEAGVRSEWMADSLDPWTRDKQLVDSILMRDAEAMIAAEPTTRRYVRVSGVSARELLWARTQADWFSKQTGVPTVALVEPPEERVATEIPKLITAESVAVDGVLPRCPGPFGGTTVLLLQSDENPDDVEAWLKLEQDDPLTRESRFYRVRVATLGGERSLPNVLTKLRGERRTNVLIVPATFYVTDGTMSAALDATSTVEGMTIHWMPGLGGRTGSIRAPEVESPPAHTP